MRRLTLGALGAAVLMFGACGGAGESASPARTVNIEMRDIAFAPDSISVPDGALVELRFHNRGRLTHDAFVGDARAQKAHGESMHENMGGHHMGSDPAVTVKPGRTAVLRHRFRKGDDVLIGCHQAGHYQAGMRLTVEVN